MSGVKRLSVHIGRGLYHLGWSHWQESACLLGS